MCDSKSQSYEVANYDVDSDLQYNVLVLSPTITKLVSGGGHID